MKINSIQYKNYRCFLDMKIDFKTKPGKNIFMVEAPNGGGKTEMLFSFQWVLYGFDFSDLKGKEDTPYSLNSTLYQSLSRSTIGDKKSCSVELEFEAANHTYNIVRTETFIKNRANNISSEMHISLSSTNAHGVRSTPIDDEETVVATLSKIIPKSILQGIIFDGERMKQLSNTNDDSKKAVEGVIRQITNEELFERCKTEFSQLRETNSKAYRRLANNVGGGKFVELDKTLSDDLLEIDEIDDNLDKKNRQLVAVNARLESIHKELSDSRETKSLEDQRSNYKKELSKKTEELDVLYDRLRDDLDDGYLLISDPILQDVKTLLDEYDIPSGLTVTAVRNILSRPRCICGSEFCEESRKALEELIKQLPPDNVNSAIGEMVNHAKIDKSSLSVTLKRTYTDIKSAEKRVNELKELIVGISTRISDGSPEKIQELERENIEKTKTALSLDAEIKALQERSIELKKEVIDLKKQKAESDKFGKAFKVLSARENFIDKCLKAIQALGEYNKMESLHQINEMINDSYKILSEDYDNGRRLYIVQYDKRSKYRMASYLQSKFDIEFARNNTKDIVEAYLRSGSKDPEGEIREQAILSVLDSNSTGQAKVNTLAFAKSILEYSRANRNEESTEISRSYPFLIDSPFTELSDDNLMKPAKNLHLFAEQVILLISKESLDSVRDCVTPYIGGSVKLMKNNNDSSSTLIK